MIRNKLFKEHELRQGWGGEGFDLNQSLDQFIESWEKKWDPDNMTDREYKKRKYNNLSIMKEISVGDIIIIPKLNEDSDGGRYFTIVRCEGTYEFDPLKIINYKGEEDTDFGHLLHVAPVKNPISYNSNHYSREICAKFRAYQNALNRVYNEDFISAIDHLINMPFIDQRQDMSSMEALSTGTAHSRNNYLQEIVRMLNNWSPSQLERIIEELFKKQGYDISQRNHCDGVGGDVDIVFRAFPENSFMVQLIGASSSMIDTPEIHVQAKKKTGNDRRDMEGIEQLLKMRGNRNALDIVINTTEKFSDKAIKYAEEEGIVLINGIQFADCLVQNGLDFRFSFDS